MTMEERVEAAAKTFEWPDAFADHKARAALAAAFPELTGPNPTHRIVPVEPSERMLDAAVHAERMEGRKFTDMLRAVYRAMLEASHGSAN